MTGVGHDRHLSVTVNAPGGLVISTVDDAQGQINFEAKETGASLSQYNRLKKKKNMREKDWYSVFVVNSFCM